MANPNAKKNLKGRHSGKMTAEPTPEFLEKVAEGDFIDPKTGKLCGMTPNQVQVAHEFIQNGCDLVEAICTVGQKVKRTSALARSKDLSKNPIFTTYVNRLLVESGMFVRASRCVDDALDAKVIYKGEETEAPDHKVRLQAAERVFKFAGVDDHSFNAANDKVDRELVDMLSKEHIAILEFVDRHNGRWPSGQKGRNRVIAAWEKKQAAKFDSSHQYAKNEDV